MSKKYSGWGDAQSLALAVGETLNKLVQSFGSDRIWSALTPKMVK
jgi:hypothetical protein